MRELTSTSQRACLALLHRASEGFPRYNRRIQRKILPMATPSAEYLPMGLARSRNPWQPLAMESETHGADRRASVSGLDAVSRKIIERLQQDGRESYAAIAREVGLSEAAVRNRVQRLLDSEVMQIVAVTDPLQVGFRRQAMVAVKVMGELEPVASALAALHEVSYVVTTAGSVDVLAEVICEDDDQLLEVLSRRIRTIPGVAGTETFVYLKLHKQHYDWGTR